MSSKKPLPLFVSARRSSWRMIDWHADESDRRYAAIRKTVLERDDFTCAYCLFRSTKYQHIHHINHDHGNVKLTNLVTVCPLCHQCFHLGLAGVKASGTMVYVPEFTQAEINNMARACFIGVYRDGANKDASKDLYKALEDRYSLVDDLLGNGANDPAWIGQAFVEMRPELYAQRKDRLPGLRLLPRMEAFSREIVHWETDAANFGALADADWSKLAPEDLEDDAEVPESTSGFESPSSHEEHDDQEIHFPDEPAF